MNVFRDSVVLMAVVGLLLIIEPGAEAIEVVHYKSFRHAGERVIDVDHFEIGNLILSCEISPAWACFEGSDDLAVSFVNRELQACSIQIQFFPISSVPEDEKAARKLYRTELGKLPSPNVDKGSRAPAFKDAASFPLMYTLAASKDVPPHRMVTFFIRKPFLFRVTIDFPEKLIAQPRVDYETMVASITVKDKVPPLTPAKKSGGKPQTSNGLEIFQKGDENWSAPLHSGRAHGLLVAERSSASSTVDGVRMLGRMIGEFARSAG